MSSVRPLRVSTSSHSGPLRVHRRITRPSHTSTQHTHTSADGDLYTSPFNSLQANPSTMNPSTTHGLTTNISTHQPMQISSPTRSSRIAKPYARPPRGTQQNAMRPLNASSDKGLFSHASHASNYLMATLGSVASTVVSAVKNIWPFSQYAEESHRGSLSTAADEIGSRAMKAAVQSSPGNHQQSLRHDGRHGVVQQSPKAATTHLVGNSQASGANKHHQQQQQQMKGHLPNAPSPMITLLSLDESASSQGGDFSTELEGVLKKRKRAITDDERRKIINLLTVETVGSTLRQDTLEVAVSPEAKRINIFKTQPVITSTPVISQTFVIGQAKSTKLDAPGRKFAKKRLASNAKSDMPPSSESGSNTNESKSALDSKEALEILKQKDDNSTIGKGILVNPPTLFDSSFLTKPFVFDKQTESARVPNLFAFQDEKPATTGPAATFDPPLPKLFSFNEQATKTQVGMPGKDLLPNQDLQKTASTNKGKRNRVDGDGQDADIPLSIASSEPFANSTRIKEQPSSNQGFTGPLSVPVPKLFQFGCGNEPILLSSSSTEAVPKLFDFSKVSSMNATTPIATSPLHPVGVILRAPTLGDENNRTGTGSFETRRAILETVTPKSTETPQILSFANTVPQTDSIDSASSTHGRRMLKVKRKA